MKKKEIKIDFIIPWVNFEDKDWQKSFNKIKKSTEDNINPARYRDWGLLKYLFRGIEKNTPWVNRIWVITDCEMPEWYNNKNKKVRIIKQSNILKEKDCPNFNINAVELNMHRIIDLSDYFVYINDDMFFLKYTPSSLFFKNGLPCDSALLSPIIVTRKQDVGSIAVNNMCLINTHFEKNKVIHSRPGQWINIRYGKLLIRSLFVMPWRHFTGFYNPHLPQPFLKSTFQEVWECEKDRLEEVTSHRFRNYYSDINQWLIRYWQLCKGSFCPSTPNRGKDLSVLDIEKTTRTIKKQKFYFVCINDDEKIQDITEYKTKLIEAFEKIFPDKSEFEK